MSDALDEDLIHRVRRYTFKLLHILLWAFLAFIGILFKIMHWPGATMFLLLGFAGLLAYSISGLIRLRGKNILNNISFATAAIWTIYIFYSYLFENKHFFNSNGLIIYIALVMIILFIYEIAWRKRKQA